VLDLLLPPQVEGAGNAPKQNARLNGSRRSARGRNCGCNCARESWTSA